MPADFFSQIGTLGAHLRQLQPVCASRSASPASAACSCGRSLFARGALRRAAARAPAAAHWPSRVPGPIVALVLADAGDAGCSALPVETIGTRFGGIPRRPARARAAAASAGTARKQLLIPTITIALLGAIESLLCARVADNLTDLPRHDPNQELMAQGVANMVAPFFGGIPATGTIARTVTNVRAGATARSPASCMR